MRTSQASAGRENQPAPVPPVEANEQPLPDFPDEDEVAFELEPRAFDPDGDAAPRIVLR